MNQHLKQAIFGWFLWQAVLVMVTISVNTFSGHFLSAEYGIEFLENDERDQGEMEGEDNKREWDEDIYRPGVSIGSAPTDLLRLISTEIIIAYGSPQIVQSPPPEHFNFMYC